ncbi:unnamed protein product [Calypogeia fissa]
MMACIRVASLPAVAIPSWVSRWTSSCSSSNSSSPSQAAPTTGGRRLHTASRLSFANGGFQERKGAIGVQEVRRARICASSDEGVYLPDLAVPKAWVAPEVAAQEAEWLRGALQQWLDDEYCPEPANEEISKRCAKVYYYCLLEEQLDVGDILMQMVRDLETFSFKESFHGAFSSANAAIDLITRRMKASEQASNN